MEPKTKGALVLIHIQQEGACTFGKTLVERGMRVRTISTPKFDMSEIEAERPDLLVVMGGPVGVYQAEDFPFLKTEIDIIKRRLDKDLPTLGVCLGAQLMAAALGSKVYKGAQGREVGWKPLHLVNGAQDGPCKHLAANATNMFHWHGDTFDLPDGAKLLASSEQYKNQIFTYGKNAMALQCHPEVQAGQLEEWYVTFQDDITGDNPAIPVKELRAQTHEHIETLNKQAKLFMNAWLDEVGL